MMRDFRPILPTCAKCKKPVEEMIRCMYDSQHAECYIVKCHGEEERYEISGLFKIWATDPNSRLSLCEVFNQALPPGETKLIEGNKP